TYACVPGAVRTVDHAAPIPIEPESHVESEAVEVWGRMSWFDHSTVSPGATTSESGWKRNPWITTRWRSGRCRADPHPAMAIASAVTRQAATAARHVPGVVRDPAVGVPMERRAPALDASG